MEYTLLFLAIAGVLGILVHNLIKMNAINRQFNGDFDIMKYWKVERFSILISLVVVAGALMARYDIEQLSKVVNVKLLTVVGFFAIGYTAQSIVVAIGGRAQKIIDNTVGDGSPNNKDV